MQLPNNANGAEPTWGTYSCWTRLNSEQRYSSFSAANTHLRFEVVLLLFVSTSALAVEISPVADGVGSTGSEMSSGVTVAVEAEFCGAVEFLFLLLFFVPLAPPPLLDAVWENASALGARVTSLPVAWRCSRRSRAMKCPIGSVSCLHNKRN